MDRIKLAKNIVSGKNPQQVYKSLMDINPVFKKFIEDNEGKSVEDIAMEYDIDLEMIRKFM